jgi:hypothetical protein
MNDQEDPGQDQDMPTPFTFKLMIVLTVLYLGYRLAQGVVWVVERLLD